MTPTRIDADLLIPGRGDPVRDASVVFDGPTLDYVGPSASAPQIATTYHVAAVMPGLWDCHGHFFGVRTAAMSDTFTDPIALRAARAAKDAEIALQAGFTSVREAGGLGVHLARGIADGTLTGPSIYAPGAILSTTGGHGDIHNIPLDWAHGIAETRLCDGPVECMRAVREQLRVGARTIKICASGGVLSELDDPIHQQFNAAELRAIVETAAMAQRSVMAHCHGKPGIMAAIEAGVLTIEHGTYLDDEACAAMKETGAILVPTRYIVARLAKAGRSSGMSAENARKLYEIADIHLDAIGRAHAAGVRIAAGTDIFESGRDNVIGWGQNGGELPLLVEAGLSALEAIEAATATAPETLGEQAPIAGQLVEGWDADVITVDTDPVVDIAALADPDRITGVWRHGVPAKLPAPVSALSGTPTTAS